MNSPLPPRETLTVEFKSDRNKLSDRDLIEAITYQASTEFLLKDLESVKP
jgi:ATP-dependent DNA helicase RecG